MEKNNNTQDTKIDELVSKISKGSRKSTSKKEVNINDVDFDKLDPSDLQAHKDLFSGITDIYKIIGVSPDDSQDHIKKKCNEKLAKYHPDKIKSILAKFPEDMRSDEKVRLTEQYKLIKEAYNILRDPEKRKYHDLQKKTMESKNFAKQKSSFDDFIKLQESEINEQSKKNAENNFKLNFLEMDSKHNFKRNEMDDEPLSKEVLNRKMQDMEMSRKQQDIEVTHKNLFEGKSFNPTDFNKAWEKQKRKDERKKQKNPDKSVILWDGVGAANDTGIGGSSNYVSVDNDYGDLYSSTNYDNSAYATNNNQSEGSESDISEGSDGIDVDYVTGHNKNNDDVGKRYEDYMKSREQDDEFYKARELGDNSWKSVMDNPTSISSQMNAFVGKSPHMLSHSKKNNGNTINKSTIDAYKQLMLERDKEMK